MRHTDIHINEKECLSIIIAMKKWGFLMVGRKCIVRCDNMVTVEAVNSGRAKNKFMQACLSEIAFLSAKFNTLIKVMFVSGTCNEISDCLSRWESEEKLHNKFLQLNEELRLKEIGIYDTDFQFSNKW